MALRDFGIVAITLRVMWHSPSKGAANFGPFELKVTSPAPCQLTRSVSATLQNPSKRRSTTTREIIMKYVVCTAWLGIALALGKVDHPDVQKRAQEVLNELDKYKDHILQWVTAGPFQASGKDGAAIYRTVFPPESGPDRAEWKPLTKGIGSWEINLESTYGGLDFVAAYLRTRVWSDVEQDVQLEMGSDDGIKAWLNGNLLYDDWAEGGISPREKLVKTKLLKGWNDLMLKVVDQQGGWVGACRIRKPDGTALEGLKYKAE